MSMRDAPAHVRAAWWWLALSSGFFVVFGVATAWLGQLPPGSLWGTWVAEALFARPFTADELALYDFLRGPLGGTMAGSYAMQCALVWVPLRRGEAWAWWAILAGMLVWFVVDSGASAYHGAWFNIARINVVALTVTGLGLAGTWSLVRGRG